METKYCPDLDRINLDDLSSLTDAFLGKSAGEKIGRRPPVTDSKSTSYVEDDEQDIERGILVTVIGRTPASIELGEEILATVRRKSTEMARKALASDGGSTILELKGFGVGWDKSEKSTVLRGKVLNLFKARPKDNRRPGGVVGQGPGMYIGDDDTAHGGIIKIKPKPGVEEVVIEEEDPMFEGEEAVNDRFFVAMWVFQIVSDGIEIPDEEEDDSGKSSSRRSR